MKVTPTTDLPTVVNKATLLRFSTCGMSPDLENHETLTKLQCAEPTSILNIAHIDFIRCIFPYIYIYCIYFNIYTSILQFDLAFFIDMYTYIYIYINYTLHIMTSL